MAVGTASPWERVPVPERIHSLPYREPLTNSFNSLLLTQTLRTYEQSCQEGRSWQAKDITIVETISRKTSIPYPRHISFAL